jgi:DNA-binding transcriptional MerR regulator
MPDQKLKNKKNQVKNEVLPEISNKVYFNMGEACKLCGLKAHVLRYWEQEFPSLNPSKRRGNRRYYQRKDILLLRRIKELLYRQGFTIEGARTKLTEEARGEVEVPEASLARGDVLKEVVGHLETLLEDLA